MDAILTPTNVYNSAYILAYGTTLINIYINIRAMGDLVRAIEVDNKRSAHYLKLVQSVIM